MVKTTLHLAMGAAVGMVAMPAARLAKDGLRWRAVERMALERIAARPPRRRLAAQPQRLRDECAS